tara:strand:- start:24 stop:731 length:708 start_codon:yes stop_codon:yes gene_type:complete
MATAPAAPGSINKPAAPQAASPQNPGQNPAKVSPAVPPSAKPKAERVVESVKMTDGRVVEFVNKKRMIKESMIEGDTVKVRLDFRNAETRTFVVPAALILKFCAHGAEQKLGDETAGTEKVDDMVIEVDDLMERLSKGEWGTVRTAGDSFAGASVVIRALVAVTQKPVQTIKDFLQKKLDNAKAKGEALSRKALYDSFRDPRTPVGQKIRELEDADRAKATGFDVGAALDELKAA